MRKPGQVRRSVAERGVWSDGVVVDAPALCQHSDLFHRVEDLSIEELISELGVEALAVAVLPGRAGFDIQRLCSCVCQPLSQILGDELRAIVGTDMLWYSFADHDIGQRPDHPSRTPAPLGPD